MGRGSGRGRGKGRRGKALSSRKHTSVVRIEHKTVRLNYPTQLCKQMFDCLSERISPWEVLEVDLFCTEA